MENYDIEKSLWEIMVCLNRLKEYDEIEAAYFAELIEINDSIIKMLDILKIEETDDRVLESN